MPIIDDTKLPKKFDNVEIINRVGTRRITHVFHDIDGTHSLIRDWPPVMSVTLHDVIVNGLEGDYDSQTNVRRLVNQSGSKVLEETDSFCVESAGLSALTQMEWAIRRGIESGSIPAQRVGLDAKGMEVNSEIIRRIWKGEEVFDEFNEGERLKTYLKENTPRLFKLYENVLKGACRDRNLELARKNPEAWRVPGALEFLGMLKTLGVKNYFVTGAVIERDQAGRPSGNMYEEVIAVGFEIGPGKVVDTLEGSTWNHKATKSEVIKQICREEGLDGRETMVVGDGRSEVSAGAEIGAVIISRLPDAATRQRELHKQLGTNVIVTDYTSERFKTMFRV